MLIKGENGTGKELVARTIHNLSPRSSQPLIDVNCAAISEELIESELFGHEKGSFSGAGSKMIGKFQLADKGTLFLDEIGDMSLKTQSKILRVLQEKHFHRVGGSRTLEIDVRVIAATNKDIEALIEKGDFREDLYYRLNVVPIEVPPLRERSQDIPKLVEAFLEEAAKKNAAAKKTIAEQAVQMLQQYHWPGNVRELKNLIERLVIIVNSKMIQAENLPKPYNPSNAGVGAQAYETLFGLPGLKEARQTFEKQYIERKLDEFSHNVTHTAQAIGVERSYLHRRIKKLSIKS